SHVPANSGMAFVVILRLPPEHQSIWASQLQSEITVPVKQVTRTVKVEPNHLYVLPPLKYIGVRDGHIRLEAESGRGGDSSIDLLFRALADAYGKNAAAILFPGTGADGTLGLRRIKENGGFVIVQDPAEAECPGMPRSAMDSPL